MKSRCLLVSAIVMAWCLATPPAAHGTLSAQARSVAIRAGKVLDVNTRTYLMGQMIWVEGQSIRQIGLASELSRQLPIGTPVIDLSDATVLPGLIDCHVHLTVSPDSLANATAAAK